MTKTKKAKKVIPATNYVCPTDPSHYNSSEMKTLCPVCGDRLAKV